MTDYRALAYEWAGPGNEKHVDAVAAAHHYNESLHMHDLGKEKKQHGACSYCWLRAGRAVHALVKTGAIVASQADGSERDADARAVDAMIMASVRGDSAGLDLAFDNLRKRFIGRIAELDAREAKASSASDPAAD